MRPIDIGRLSPSSEMRRMSSRHLRRRPTSREHPAAAAELLHEPRTKFPPAHRCRWSAIPPGTELRLLRRAELTAWPRHADQYSTPAGRRPSAGAAPAETARRGMVSDDGRANGGDICRPCWRHHVMKWRRPPSARHEFNRAMEGIWCLHAIFQRPPVLGIHRIPAPPAAILLSACPSCGSASTGKHRSLLMRPTSRPEPSADALSSIWKACVRLEAELVRREADFFGTELNAACAWRPWPRRDRDEGLRVSR